MKTIQSKLVTILVCSIMVLNQSMPVGAIYNPQPVQATESETTKPSFDSREQDKKATKPKLYHQPQAPEPVAPDIQLTADPIFVTGDATVTIAWSVAGDLPEGGPFTLEITFPEGYTPVTTFESSPTSTAEPSPTTTVKATSTSTVEPSMTNTVVEPVSTNTAEPLPATANSITIPVSANSTSGEFSLVVTNPLDEAIFPAVLLDAQDQAISKSTLSLPKHEQFTVDEDGGTVSADEGRITVTFPDGALPEDATINVGAPAGDERKAPVQSLSGNAFEIEAQGTQSEDNITQFPENVTIEVDYSDLDLQGKNEQNLYLYYYDPETNDWYALPSLVDPETQTLTATTTHFTVFDTGINDWQGSRMPTVDNFQHAGYTGAASYSLPLQVPAGPAGLQPSLNLSYNSQTVDQSTAQTQASWVGMGWSLDMNMISLDDHGTNNRNEGEFENSALDDTWSVNANGISSTIVKDGSEYRAADENFIKIVYNDSNDTWTVWDKSGNTYYFTQQVKTIYSKNLGANNTDGCGYDEVTYQWYLTSMKNIYGQQLSYAYVNDTKTVTVPQIFDDHCRTSDYNGNLFTVTAVTATYPTTITYPGEHYRVRFVTTSRSDYRGSWAADAAYHAFQQKRLYAVVMEQDENGDDTWNIIRKYLFEYASDTSSDLIWPGVTWNTSGKTNTLLQVHEFGVNGAEELPTATFEYGDKMHLTYADNGYGGAVEFVYSPWSYEAHARKSQTYSAGFSADSSDECQDTGGFTGGVACQDDNTDHLIIRGRAINTTRLNNWATFNNAIRPGGKYRLSASKEYAVHTDNDSNTPAPVLQVGFFDGTQDQLVTASGGGGVVTLPVTLGSADIVFNVVNGNAYGNHISMTQFKAELLMTIYRVTQRKVSDGEGHTYTYSYDYTNSNGDTAAVNDDAHLTGECTDSALEANPPTCWQYHEKYSQFRGNGQVTQTSPDGYKTITVYDQSDTLKGRATSVTVTDANGTKLTKHITTYTVHDLGMTTLASADGHAYNDGNFHTWITTDSEENLTYNSNGTTYTGTKTVYTYDETYGNTETKEEFAWTGSAWASDAYRTTTYEYYPNDTTGVYLVGLLARQKVIDADDNTISKSVNIYDSNTTWADEPSVGKLSAVRTWVGGTADYAQVSYGYDSWGNRTSTTVYPSYGTDTTAPSSTGALTSTTVFDSIYHTYPTAQQTPDVGVYTSGFITHTDYDYTLGLPIEQTDPNGVVTKVDYDSFGRLIKVAKDGDTLASPTLQITYYDTAQPFMVKLKQKVSDTTSYMLCHIYDGMGREISTQTGYGTCGEEFEVATQVDKEYYFDLTNHLSVTLQSVVYDPDETETPPVTTSKSDGLGRPVSVIAPGNNTTASYAYDGLETTVTDANGHATTTTRDVWGNTTAVNAPTGPDISYEYDTLGQLTKAIRGGVETEITYNRAGQKTSMSDPDMGDWYYRYDAFGNLITQIDAKRQATNLYYDTLNRLVGKTYDNGPVTISSYTRPNTSNYTISYLYDQGGAAAFALGRRTRMEDTSGATTWKYDERGRVTEETKDITNVGSYTTETSYNNADMPLTITYPDGEEVTNEYNSQKQLESVSGLDTYIQNIAYDVAGRVTSRTLGNGVTSSYSYYNWGELSGGVYQGGRLHTLESGASASLQDITYTYDAVGNIKKIQDNASDETQNFDYDALDRLTSALVTNVAGTITVYNNGYSYNATTGNLETKAGVTLNYQDSDHAHAVTSMGSNTYDYDANGNQTTRTINGRTYNLTYNVEGQLIAVESTIDSPAPLPTAYPINTATSVPGATTTPTKTVTKTSTPTKTATPTASATPYPAGVDSYTRALLHFDGADASTTLTDETGRTWSAVGNAQLDTSAKKYGSASLQLDGSGDEITSADSSAFYWSTQDFTIDFWTRITTLPTSGNNAAFYAQTEDGSNWARLYLANSSGTYYWVFRVYDGGNQTINVQKATTITAGTWHHIALVRNGNNFMIFENGTQLGSTVTDSDPVPDLADVARLGTSDGTNWPLAGRIDEFILSKGIARWTSGFVPGPTNTPTATPTRTKTPTRTVTPTRTATATATATKTPTQTPVASNTPTATKTATASPTVSPTATNAPATNLSASFAYDGNGQMVKAVINNRKTAYISAAYQIANPNTPAESITKHYAGGAMRVDGVVYYTLSDHIGSTSITINNSGNKTAEMRYKAWGEVRYENGNLQTDRTYTGQRSYTDDFGLMFYNARWYDSQIGRFAQTDTIVPPGIQGYDRYAYVSNNPINRTDPSGHCDAPGLIASTTSGLGPNIVGFLGSCISDVQTAISSYQKGDRNSFNLVAEATGAKRDIQAATQFVNELNADTASAFSDAPLEERLPHVVHLSIFAVGVAASVVPGPAAKAASAADDAIATGSGALDDLVKMACPNSFEASTAVSTVDGKKAISDLQIGDQVLAFDEKTGKTGYYTITKVWINHDPVLTEVILDGEYIETTPEHPFFTQEKGWVAASELTFGMHVRRANGEYGLVWWAWNVERAQVMYNLTVNTAHTYFVGDGQWLVHNTGGCPTGGIPNPIYDSVSAAHVDPRHVNLQTFPNKSKFLPGEANQGLADEIYANASAAVTQADDGFIRLYANLNRAIGTNGQTWARLVMDPKTGWVKTMFPQGPYTGIP